MRLSLAARQYMLLVGSACRIVCSVCFCLLVAMPSLHSESPWIFHLSPWLCVDKHAANCGNKHLLGSSTIASIQKLSACCLMRAVQKCWGGPPARTEKRKDYTFRRQTNEKPRAAQAHTDCILTLCCHG